MRENSRRCWSLGIWSRRLTASRVWVGIASSTPDVPAFYCQDIPSTMKLLRNRKNFTDPLEVSANSRDLSYFFSNISDLPCFCWHSTYYPFCLVLFKRGFNYCAKMTNMTFNWKNIRLWPPLFLLAKLSSLLKLGRLSYTYRGENIFPIFFSLLVKERESEL